MLVLQLVVDLKQKHVQELELMEFGPTTEEILLDVQGAVRENVARLRQLANPSWTEVVV